MHKKNLNVSLLIRVTVPVTGDRVSDCLDAVGTAKVAIDHPAHDLIRMPGSRVSIVAAEEVDAGPAVSAAPVPARIKLVPPSLVDIVAAIPDRAPAAQASQDNAPRAVAVKHSSGAELCALFWESPRAWYDASANDKELWDKFAERVMLRVAKD